MTTVKTDLGNTRESARRLRFEPASPLTSTNVQKAIEELTGLLPTAASTLNVTTGAGAPTTATDFVYVNFAGTVTITLPDAGAWLAAHSLKPNALVIQDISNAANDTTRKITINRAGADTINGATSIEIVAPMGGFALRPPAAGSWEIQ